MEKQSKTQITSWTRGKCIGKGSFGNVSLAINEANGAVFAVKSVDLKAFLPNQVESLENEIRVLRSLSSPYVVEYLGDDVTLGNSYRNLHLEYLPGGTVSDVANVKRRLADVDGMMLRCHTRCLVSALKHVHDQGIVHCDVKGRNVLLGMDSTAVKLADFGSAIEIKKKSEEDISRHLITPRGSPLWMAPEVIRGEYQGPESDVWSLGCTVIEMITGQPAWEDHGLDSLRRIANSEELPELPTQLSKLGKDFVDKCLRRDPNQRWSCDQLLQHPFVASASPPKMMGESSPRCVLDFASSDFKEKTENFESSARERIGKLAAEGGGVNWESEVWATVRSYAIEPCVNCEEGTSTEYPELTRTRLEISNSFDDSGNSVYRQCDKTKNEIRVKSSLRDLRCGGWRGEMLADSSCGYGSKRLGLRWRSGG
ncbi:Clathrin, heavy chain isoform 1 [Hibiscus syriacus]|uniref:Clathrin, heavy chain isoform 1 n=1 Tax=Hibiscus syriacus TaxID=106335 RepID=A0A6A2Z9X8_HIBSY|nr:mitogen-activated protein kinase kinase kinase 18-like [Hibiscus syriacus]KAE8688804.1 Clathrin, heavy chain isoform 1 [Hibiscus syriacus]